MPQQPNTPQLGSRVVKHSRVRCSSDIQGEGKNMSWWQKTIKSLTLFSMASLYAAAAHRKFSWTIIWWGCGASRQGEARKLLSRISLLFTATTNVIAVSPAVFILMDIGIQGLTEREAISMSCC